MSDQQRVTLTDPATRALQMRQHVEAVAQSILTDHRADALFQQVLSSRRHIHNYSVRNRILQSWQCPLGKCFASLGAYDRIAADQGAETATIGRRRQRVMIRQGGKAVWVWGRYTSRRTLQDSVDDGQTIEVVQYRPMATWCVEDIVYAVSGEPFQLPDHVQAVDDRGLYDGLIAFAAHKQIQIVHTGIVGARGVSHGGKISLQHGDSEALQLPVLAHEVVHELLHASRDSARLPKAMVELEAETGAAVLLRHYGHDVPASSAYLRQFGVKPQEVLASMDRILRATSEVVQFVEGRE